MTDYKKHPKPKPDKNVGRSATKVSEAMSGSGQKTADGTMGKHQKTGDMMPEGS